MPRCGPNFVILYIVQLQCPAVFWCFFPFSSYFSISIYSELVHILKYGIKICMTGPWQVFYLLL